MYFMFLTRVLEPILPRRFKCHYYIKRRFFLFDVSDIQLCSRAAVFQRSPEDQFCSRAGWAGVSHHLAVKCQNLSTAEHRLCASVRHRHVCTHIYILPLFGPLVFLFLWNLLKTSLNYSSSLLQSCAPNSSFIESAKRHSLRFTSSFPSQWDFQSARGSLPDLEDNHEMNVFLIQFWDAKYQLWQFLWQIQIK